MSFPSKPLSLALGWTAFIVLLLSIPGRSFPSTSLWEYDKIAHAGLFFILAILWLRAMPTGRRGFTLSFLLVGVAFSGISELYQGMLPFDRTPDLYDSLADAVGFIGGTLVWILFNRPKSES